MTLVLDRERKASLLTGELLMKNTCLNLAAVMKQSTKKLKIF